MTPRESARESRNLLYWYGIAHGRAHGYELRLDGGTAASAGHRAAGALHHRRQSAHAHGRVRPRLANGVSLEVMQQHGIVSQESATAMAQAIRAQLGADFGIGVTGVPGPVAVEGMPCGL